MAEDNQEIVAWICDDELTESFSLLLYVYLIDFINRF